MVYHGTKADFESFDLKKCGASDEGLAGPGFYFTYNPEEASGYALNEHFGRGDAPNVRPVYVALQNPLLISNGVLPDGRTLKDFHGGIGIQRRGGQALRQWADDAGHDGVMWVTEEGHVRHVVAFRPEQVTSIFNVGRYPVASASPTGAGEAIRLSNAQRALNELESKTLPRVSKTSKRTR